MIVAIRTLRKGPDGQSFGSDRAHLSAWMAICFTLTRKYDAQLRSTSSGEMWVERAVKAHGQRVQALPQSKLQIMDVGATGKPADRLA